MHIETLEIIDFSHFQIEKGPESQLLSDSASHSFTTFEDEDVT